MNKWISIAILSATMTAVGQRCESIAASAYGGWLPNNTAPRDGTIIEAMETYGVAPTYALVQWKPWGGSELAWVHVDDPSSSTADDKCLFWRPYKGDPKRYDDPTHGAQKSMAYWCLAMHLPYDKKRDKCVLR